MREFDLSAVDWDTVRLIQAGQFKHERHYHEELVRWVMYRGGIQGVLRLDDEGISFPSPIGGMGYSVKLRGITAVTEQVNALRKPPSRFSARNPLPTEHRRVSNGGSWAD